MGGGGGGSQEAGALFYRVLSLSDFMSYSCLLFYAFIVRKKIRLTSMQVLVFRHDHLSVMHIKQRSRAA